MGVSDYDTVPGNNGTISGTDISEGCAPGNLNDAIRQIMADIATLNPPSGSSFTTLSTAQTSTAALAIANQSNITTNAAAITALQTTVADKADTADLSDLATQASVDALPIQNSYTSANQTITASGLLTLAHGLGAEPFMIQLFLECTSADLGYSVGDKVLVGQNGSDAISGRAHGIYFDATNIYVRFSNTGSWTIADKATGNGDGIDPAKWELIVRAIA